MVSSLLLVLMALCIDIPWYGRAWWGPSVFNFAFQVSPKKHHDNGIVLMSVSEVGGGVAAPFGAVVTEMPQSMRYVRIDSSQVLGHDEGKPLRMAEEVQRLVDAHDGPIYLLTINQPANLSYATALLPKYDLRVSAEKAPELITSPLTPVLGLWTLERRSREESRPTPVANGSSGRASR
jgi:hypothetical protein